MSNRRKIVIIGGVALGAGTAAKARRMDENAEIILIERGPYVSFANCGLPYYLGDVIQDREKLLLHTPASLKARFRIDTRIRQEMIAMDRGRKTVTIRDLELGHTYEESYDQLVLAMGARPITPAIPGKNLDGIFSLRTVPDVDAIKSWLENAFVKRAVVIGAGFIGLETVDNLIHLGLQVTLIEKAPQVLPPFDAEMTAPALEALRTMGVDVILNDGISRFEGTDRAQRVVLDSGRNVTGDVFILGLGVRPDVEMAKAAGLEVGATGALRVNERLQTSDSDIYSGGDLAEIIHRVTDKDTWIPLAAAANKQARIIGMNTCGSEATFHGAQGTSIVRVGQVVLGMTGLSERLLRRADIPYAVSYNTAGHHAGYYPGAKDLTIKLLFDPSSGRIFGAQVAGSEGVDKRLDVMATAISAGMTVADLADLDLAYAPPFSSAKDPVVMAGMAADNIVRDRIKVVVTAQDLVGEDVRILDVRSAHEVAQGAIPGALHIPLDDLRQRVDELDPTLRYIVYCRSGLRSYVACRIMSGLGFEHVYNLTGGHVVHDMRQQVASSLQRTEEDAATATTAGAAP